MNQNTINFIQENEFENVVNKMSAILSQSQCVKSLLFQVMAWHYIGSMQT